MRYGNSDVGDDEEDEAFWENHHTTFFQLMDCCFISDRGCHLCHLIWQAFRVQRQQQRDPEAYKLTWHKGSFKLGVTRRMETVPRGHTLHLKSNIQIVSGNRTSRNSKGFDATILNLVPPGKYPNTFYPSIGDSTDSHQVIAQLLAWLNNCRSSHDNCRRSSQQKPTRLVRIDWASQKIGVVHDIDSDEEYIALSYRWGDSASAYCLTTKTMAELSAAGGVGMECLPQVIKDACRVCSWVGVKYLWVDRLCILQDSVDDWNTEASRMASVYGNGLCTIAASCAAHDDQSLFRKRRPLCHQPLRLSRCPLTSELSQEPLLAVPAFVHLYVERDQTGFLATRGWVFQERLLSRRTIYFAEEQVYWECIEQKASDAWPEGWNSKLESYHQKIAEMAEDMDHSKAMAEWDNVVQAYTETSFSKGKDRLPGLSGLAHDFKSRCLSEQDTYLAGMWKSHIIQNLCWLARAFPGSTHYEYSRFNFPERYRAPSWSWASVDLPVECGFSIGYGKESSLADFRDAQLSFEGNDPHGAMCDGWLKLSGFLNEVTVNWDDFVLRQGSINGKPTVVRGPQGEVLDGLSFYKVHLDFNLHNVWPWPEILSRRIFCLPLVHSDLGDSKYYNECFCLFLAHKGNSYHPRPRRKRLITSMGESAVEYQRIGAGIVSYEYEESKLWDEWLARSPKQDVVIR
ncbi:Heterokaryon incompatibility [Colletotrichum scovillei]|uniref:Heterokaryon incompatibility n=1 Tax=Colletotrichum scovillei TaxID=1209932 RepID=UPI0015C3CAAE|nr:Heterokaryon incompatibility [Colletotrichum scovillei]KAF4784150.1 Heterokaryon incompatibility [Colletotrichum scovillei]